MALSTTFAAESAHAYCRKMSKSDALPSHDPVTDGCEKGGVPIYFPSTCIDYRVVVDPTWSAILTQADAEALVEKEFGIWASTTCATSDGKSTVPVALELRNQSGPKGSCEGSPSTNEVRFMDPQPAPHESSDPSTLGITRNSKRETSGVIERSATEIYIQSYGGDDSLALLHGVVRHELGHFLGMGHSDKMDAVMYYLSQSDASVTGITADDVAGICDAYSSEYPIAAGCSVTEDSPAALNLWALPLGVVAARFLRRKSRGLRAAIPAE